MEPIPILTIGYGQRSPADLVVQVKSHGVAFVIDVRSNPVSKFQPEFGKSELEPFLKTSGIQYVFMGDTLGGRPTDPTCYNDGHVVYDTVREREFFKTGIGRLQHASDGGHRICLLCAERKPEDCHRSKLIGVALQQLGYGVLHIDANNSLVSNDQVLARLDVPQGSLFPKGLKSRKAYRPSSAAQPDADVR